MRLSAFVPSRQPAHVRAETPLRAKPDGGMAAFNQQVLQSQEEAYTLALYLLGSAETAIQAVQAAVLQAYKQGGQPSGARLRLLQAVIRVCARTRSVTPQHSSEQLDARILALPLEERRAAILVDVLSLNYADAAQVLASNPRQVSAWLIRARLQFMQAVQ